MSRTDLWSKILGWLRCLSQVPGRRLKILHVRGHVGNKGNEREDELVKLDSKLRYDIMSEKLSDDWMKRAKELYWRNRKEC